MSVKAFELVPAIERLQLMGEKAQTTIECVECCGKNLYLGTSDCFVVHFLLEEKIHPSGKLSFRSEKQSHKYLAVKKSIDQLKAASALNRLLVLCDNVLTLLNMFNLEPILSGAKIKGVASFAVNENPIYADAFSMEVCVATRRKLVQLYTISADRVTWLKDITTIEIPLNVGLDNVFICAALSTQYVMINHETGEQTDLFPYESDLTNPIVKRISKNEFLLSGPSGLGMFVSSAGISERPPLQWSTKLLAVCFHFPYVCALSDQFITIYSILDQQPKQTIPFQGGRLMEDFEGKICVASNREVYAMVPVAFDKQVDALLADSHVEEALTLAKNSRRAGLSRDKHQKMYGRVQQQAGFIRLAEFKFEEAGELFKSGSLDVRELLSLFPGLLPTRSSFTRSVPLLHVFADINQVVKGKLDQLMDCKRFLASYLEDLRDKQLGVGFREEIDTALLKLYGESSDPRLLDLIASAGMGCSLPDCAAVLRDYGRHHALALLHSSHQENGHALETWIRLADRQLSDPAFPGFDFVVEFLANLSEYDLVWYYVDWALTKDEEKAVKIFTERPRLDSESERLRPDDIIDYLCKYPVAIIRYLEYIVFTKKLEKEKYHTHLAVLYLDRVLKLQKIATTPMETLNLTRSKFRQLLQNSSHYRVQLLLGKVKESEMHAECAILYGKLEEHDKALRILVYKLKDYGAAENYCEVNSKGRDESYRKRLYHILLTVYLDPLDGKQDSMVAPAISLLNNKSAEFDVARVLGVVPENWSVGLVSRFLMHTVRGGLHQARSTKVQRMLARGENLQVRVQAVHTVSRASVKINENRLCPVCNRGFTEPQFACYPNGTITHTHCARNKLVCPITGKVFSTPHASKR